MSTPDSLILPLEGKILEFSFEEGKNKPSARELREKRLWQKLKDLDSQGGSGVGKGWKYSSAWSVGTCSRPPSSGTSEACQGKTVRGSVITLGSILRMQGVWT